MSRVEISRQRPVIEERVPPKEMLAEPATVIVLQALVPGDVGENARLHLAECHEIRQRVRAATP
jgi:hypothetical protein